MKEKLLRTTAVALAMAFGVANPAIAQTTAKPDSIYEQYDVDKKASYPGGEDKMWDLLFPNIKYPEEAKKDQASANMRVYFIIEKDGSLKHYIPEDDKDLHPAFKKMGADLVKKMPKWKPAMKNGKAVRSRTSIGPFHIQYRE